MSKDSPSCSIKSEESRLLEDVETAPMVLPLEIIPIPPPQPQKKSIDDLTTLRWYCLIVLVMAEVVAFTSSASKTFMVFAGASPNVIACDDMKVNGCADFYALQNQTGCVPVLDYQFKSVQVEYNYICDDAKKVKNTITVQTFGILVGAAVFGQVSDSFGRWKALMLSSLGNAVFNLFVPFTNDLTSFMIWRTISGIFAGGLSVVQMVYMVENIPRQHRMWIQNTITWSPNMILFPIVAYFAHDWRNLSFIIAFTSLLCAVTLLFLEESPRWLVQKGRIDEARKIFIKVRKTDGLYDEEFEKELDDILSIEREKLAQSTKKNKKYTFIHLFCTWKMIARTLTFTTGIICTTFIVYAMMYNTEKLSGSLYWNSAIMGASRWAVNIVVSICDYRYQWFGRRTINQLCMTSTCIALAVTSAFVYVGYGGTVQAIGTNIAVAMCSQLFIAKYLMVNELYPTAVRNLAVSAISTMSRVGSMFSPQLFYLSDYAEWLPYAALFGFQLYDLTVFSIFIPETKGVHLENHLPPKHKRIFGKKT